MTHLVQVLAPIGWVSPFCSDFQKDLVRILLEWSGQRAIRLTRALIDEDTDESLVLRIYGEKENVILVHHIDERGNVFPPLKILKNIHEQINQLYIRWIGTEGPPSFRNLSSTLSTSLESWARNSEGTNMTLISPETETCILDNKPVDFTRLMVREIVNLKLNEDERLKDPSYFKWDEPFHLLFGRNVGIDYFHHQSAMRRCIKLKDDGYLERAICEAEAWSGSLIRKSSASYYNAVFKPRITDDLQDALDEFQRKFGLPNDSLEETLENAHAIDALYRNRPDVTLCIGWIGYFWHCLLEDLKSERAINACVRCGTIIKISRKNKVMCSKVENPACRTKYNQEKKSVERGSQRI